MQYRDRLIYSYISIVGLTIMAALLEIKLFSKCSCDDMLLQYCISVKDKYAKYMPHSTRRYAAKQVHNLGKTVVQLKSSDSRRSEAERLLDIMRKKVKAAAEREGRYTKKAEGCALTLGNQRARKAPEKFFAPYT